MKRLIVLLAFLLALPLVGAAQGISQLQQFTATTSPERAITQTVFGKLFRLTGQGSGCAQFSANGTLTSTNVACGTGSSLFGKARELISGFLWPTTTVPVKINATTTLATTTASMLNGVIVVDGVHYPQTGAGIQNALNDAAALKKCVYLPAGRYVFSTSTVLASNACLQGAGKNLTYLEGAAVDKAVIRTFQSGTSKTVYSNISLKDFSSHSQTGHIIELQNIDGLTVQGVAASSTSGAIRESLWVQHSQHVSVRNNYIYNTKGDGIQINSTDYFIVDSNIVDNSADDGIDIDSDFLDTSAIPSRYGTVSNNVVNGVIGGEGIRIEDSSDITVTGNAVNNASEGITVNTTSHAITVENITVSGNIVRNSRLVGIATEGNAAAITRNILIIGNSVFDSGVSAGGNIGAGIKANASSTQIIGNTISNGGIEGGGDDGAIVIYKKGDVVIRDNHIASSTRGINFWNGDGLQKYTSVEASNNSFTSVTTKYAGATTQPGISIVGSLFDLSGSSPYFTVGSGFVSGASSTVNGTFHLPLSAGGLAISGGTVYSFASSSLFGYTPLNPTRAITIEGTANQITSSAASQDLSADRTWTLSLPNTVIFPNAASTALFSTNYASSTLYFGANLSTCNATTGKLVWANGLFGCGIDFNAGTGASTTLLADSNTFSGTNTFSNTIAGSITGNAGTVTNGVYTTTFNSLFDNRLSATTSLPNITTLANLSLPYSQITGTPTIAAYPFALTGNATSTLTQFNAGLTAFASSTIGDGTRAGGLSISGGATTTATSSLSGLLIPSGNVGIGTLTPGAAIDIATGDLRLQSGRLNLTNAANTSEFIVGSSGAGTVSAGARNAFTINADNDANGTGQLLFQTRTLSRLVIDNGGNVGIGTSSPFSILHVTSGASATTTVTIGSVGLTSSKGCVNMNRSDGGAGSFYINAAGVMVTESNYCR